MRVLMLSKGRQMFPTLFRATPLVMILASSFALGSDHLPIVGALTKNAGQPIQLCGGGGCEPLVSSTEVFDNGNSFVRFTTSVTGRSVTLILPSEVSSDDLMEALIKVKTAQAHAASSVSVRVSGNKPLSLIAENGNPIDINLPLLFAAAGATDFRMANKSIPLSKPSPSQAKPEVTQSVLYGPTHPELVKRLHEQTGLSVETHLDFSKSQKGKRVIYVSASTPPVNENFFKTLAEIQLLTKRGGQAVLVSPYLPYARSDKVDQVGVIATVRLAADLIEASGTTAMAFVRAHAPQSIAAYSIPIFQVNGRDSINAHLKGLGIHAYISPDNGALKDVTLYAKEAGLPVGGINKMRNVLTGDTTIVGMTDPSDAKGPMSLKGLTVAIIDDETASGSTLAKAAEYLIKEKGAAKVIAVVTHLNGNAKKALDSEYISRIVVTDTLPVNVIGHPRLDVVSISKELTQTIRGLFQSSKRMGPGLDLIFKPEKSSSSKKKREIRKPGPFQGALPPKTTHR